MFATTQTRKSRMTSRTGVCGLFAALLLLFTTLSPYFVMTWNLQVNNLGSTTAYRGATGPSVVSASQSISGNWFYMSVRNFWLWTRDVSNLACSSTLTSYSSLGVRSNNGYQLFGKYFCSGPDGEFEMPQVLLNANIVVGTSIGVALLASILMFASRSRSGVVLGSLLFWVAFALTVAGFSLIVTSDYYQQLINGDGTAGLLLPGYTQTGGLTYVVLQIPKNYAFWGFSFWLIVLSSILLFFSAIFSTKAAKVNPHPKRELDLEYVPKADADFAVSGDPATREPQVFAATVV
jgi:hypothetical protein